VQSGQPRRLMRERTAVRIVRTRSEERDAPTHARARARGSARACTRADTHASTTNPCKRAPDARTHACAHVRMRAHESGGTRRSRIGTMATAATSSPSQSPSCARCT
jgi:hypothetical protein